MALARNLNRCDAFHFECNSGGRLNSQAMLSYSYHTLSGKKRVEEEKIIGLLRKE